MVIEICVHGLGPNGSDLLRQIHLHLIEGKGDDAKSFEFPERVELQSWVPPKDWADRVLDGPVGNDGICVTVNGYYDWNQEDRSDLPARVESFVAQIRKAHPFDRATRLPATVLVLACILHRSPLPPEFWRTGLFDAAAETDSTTAKKTKVDTRKQRKRKRPSIDR
jgi:hypothetical protein